MSMTVHVLGLDVAGLDAHRLVAGPLDAEDLLDDEPEVWEQLQQFHGVDAFLDDLTQRMPELAGTPWAAALGGSTGRAAPGLVSPALDDLVAAGWVLLSDEEVEQVAAAARSALEADPEWAGAGHGNGPKWAALAAVAVPSSPIAVALR